MTWILPIKYLHVTLVFISISFFIIRFLGRQMDADFMRTKVIRVAPHIIDTLLLASGITLTILYHLSPLNTPWLMVKLILIGGYILAGFGAMKAASSAYSTGYGILALSLICGVVFMATFKPI